MHRLLILAILLSFLICYIDWGHDGSEFIGQTEFFLLTDISAGADFFKGLLFVTPMLAGQIFLLIALFQRRPNRGLIITGIIMLGLYVLAVFGLGLFTFQMNVFLSTMPFLIVAIVYMLISREDSSINNDQLID